MASSQTTSTWPCPDLHHPAGWVPGGSGVAPSHLVPLDWKSCFAVAVVPSALDRRRGRTAPATDFSSVIVVPETKVSVAGCKRLGSWAAPRWLEHSDFSEKATWLVHLEEDHGRETWTDPYLATSAGLGAGDLDAWRETLRDRVDLVDRAGP